MSTTTAPAWTFEVDGMPPSPNRRLGILQRRQIVAPLVDSIQRHVRALGLPEPLLRARVVVTLTYPPGDALRDFDNAVSSLKECIDALVRGGLLADDGPAYIDLEVRQATGEGRAVIFEVFPGIRSASGGGNHG
jgi:hypothetical protein